MHTLDVTPVTELKHASRKQDLQNTTGTTGVEMGLLYQFVYALKGKTQSGKQTCALGNLKGWLDKQREQPFFHSMSLTTRSISVQKRFT
jgi:hypothetical protein